MAALQRAAQSNMSTTSSGWWNGAEMVVSEQFPAGLRILVVDDDTTCLRILGQMLRRLLYHVTTCSQATVALDLLRKQKGCFDMVLSDVHMPDMDGYKLLEHVGLEMNLPVIMMSGDGRISAVMKGIKHGACDYLIKPIREEELKNIWQHVVRMKWNETKEVENSGSFENNDQNKQGNEETENASSVSESIEGASQHQKKRSFSKEEDEDEIDNEDPATSKKPRVVWSVELHQQFVSAVNQLGIDKAVPKRILELMNVPGLTRENVASHLQKFRLYLKRLSGAAQPGGPSNTVCGNIESNMNRGALGRYDIQALVASGQIHPQAAAALLGSAGSNVTIGDPPALVQASWQGVKRIPVEHGMAFGQQMLECQSNASKQFQNSFISTEDLPSGFGAWPPNNLSTVGVSHVGRSNSQNKDLLVDISRQQCQQQQKQLENSALSEPNHVINVRPSCLVVPSQSSNSFSAVKSPTSVNQSSSFSRGAIFDYSPVQSQSNISSLNIRQIPDAYLKTTSDLSGYPAPAPLIPSGSSCSVSAENSSGFQAQNTNNVFGATRQPRDLGPVVGSVQGLYSANSIEVFDQIPNESLRSAVQGPSIPRRFALDEFESSMNGLDCIKGFVGTNSNRIKQEPDADFTNSTKGSSQVLQQFLSNDLMGIFTK